MRTHQLSARHPTNVLTITNQVPIFLTTTSQLKHNQRVIHLLIRIYINHLRQLFLLILLARNVLYLFNTFLPLDSFHLLYWLPVIASHFITILFLRRYFTLLFILTRFKPTTLISSFNLFGLQFIRPPPGFFLFISLRSIFFWIWDDHLLRLFIEIRLTNQFRTI